MLSLREPLLYKKGPMLLISPLRNLFIILILLANAELAVADRDQQGLKISINTIAVSPYGIEHTEESRGIYYELADSLNGIKLNSAKLNRSQGFHLEHQISPYARIIHELKNGQTDLTIMFKYQELEQYVTYITPLPSLKNVVIGLQGNQFDNTYSLEGKTVAYLRGAKFSDAIDNNRKILKITTKDFQQGINMLAAKRVDAIIGPMDPILAAAQFLNKPADFFGRPLVVSERTPWIQISNRSELMSQRKVLKRHFDQLLASGKLEQLRAKYLLYYHDSYYQEPHHQE